MKKWINNNGGSTLLMVMIVMIALSILGVALLSMTMMNVNMKYNDRRSKKSAYYTEAGIDQVYALIANEVMVAIKQANDYTEAKLVEITTDLPENEGLYDFDGDGISTQYYVGEVDKQELNQEEFKNLADMVYREGVMGYFHGTLDTTTYTVFDFSDSGTFKSDIANLDMDSIKKLNSTLDDTISSLEVTIGGYEIVSEPKKIDSTATFKNVTATMIYKNLTSKTITTDIVITAPKNRYPLSITETHISATDNPIWQNALVSVEDIIFENGTSSKIIGDVYGYGFGDATDKINDSDYGGIKVASGAVTIEGDVVSRSNVHTADLAELTIKNSHVYCNSLVTDRVKKSSTETDGSKITLTNSTLYTYDDLELNGDASQITINGRYFGYNSGGDTISHNNSSSIIINADLENSGTKLSISGVKPIISNTEDIVNEGLAETDSYYDLNDQGIFIAGNAYINTLSAAPDEDKTITTPYQTGESVAVKGNYIAYINPERVNMTGYTKEKTEAGFDLIVKDGGKDGTDKFETNERQGHFFEYYNAENEIIKEANDDGLPAPIDRLIKTGGDQIDIDWSKVCYSLGAIIVDDASDNDTVEAFKGGLSNHFNLQNIIKKDYKYYLNTSTYLDYSLSMTYNADELPLDEVNIIENCTNLYKPETKSYQDIKMLDSFIKDNTSVTTMDITYVQKNASSLTINTSGTVTPSGRKTSLDNVICVPDGYLQGIIITEGSVTIEGNLKFAGVIIAGDNIIISGGTSETIGKEFFNPNIENADYQKKMMKYLVQKIGKDSDLQAVFDHSDYTSDPPLGYLDNFEVKTVSKHNAQHTYSDIISFKNWEIQ